MKKVILFFIGWCAFAISNAQQIDIQLWADNYPVAFQCHTEGKAGDNGKFASDQQLEFWESDEDGIDMRWTAFAVYANGNIRNYSYIYHGKREKNRIIFATMEDGDSMEGTSDIETIDPSFQPFEAVILNTKQILFDRCTYDKMKMDFTKGIWIKD